LFPGIEIFEKALSFRDEFRVAKRAQMLTALFFQETVYCIVRKCRRIRKNNLYFARYSMNQQKSC
jgi:hypothetical protein